MNKEAIKQFLRPNWKKFLILPITYFGHYFLGPSIGMRGWSNIYAGISSNFFPFNYILGEFYSCGNVPFVETCFNWKGFGYCCPETNIFHLLILLILFSIFWYLLSCLIIFTYDKFRPKR
ncbi:hypothetical protein B5M47_02825 [candidate division CPR3 bacterium 4484_211]|uniref:Uncharacterized protein n=1 Tax=candidate division CPR3 bacterium 4484_211 TaxID=1968527 RepID=A0A1W9NXW9_UNCC3|nr:MAG: hypothetical protein B5M47_02825 [candidate division CPR3 bacterium 4484_211]